jgi:cystathionine beta-lyase
MLTEPQVRTGCETGVAGQSGLGVSMAGNGERDDLRVATRLTTAGRDPFAHHGYVNTPVYHASTLLYRSAEDYLAHRGRYQYGRRGTPTSEALETALKSIEGPRCEAVALLPSGLAAISAALLSVVRAGDHILVTDSATDAAQYGCGFCREPRLAHL